MSFISFSVQSKRMFYKFLSDLIVNSNSLIHTQILVCSFMIYGLYLVDAYFIIIIIVIIFFNSNSGKFWLGLYSLESTT